MNRSKDIPSVSVLMMVVKNISLKSFVGVKLGQDLDTMKATAYDLHYFKIV